MLQRNYSIHKQNGETSLWYFFYPHPACVLRRYKTRQTAPSPFQCNKPSPVRWMQWTRVLHLRVACACEAEEGKEAAATSLAHLPVTPAEQPNPGCLLLSSSWPLIYGVPCSRTCHPQGKQKGRVASHRKSAFNWYTHLWHRLPCHPTPASIY